MRDGITHLFKFGVQSGDRVLELSTGSDLERIKWMDAIHNAVRSLRDLDRSTTTTTSDTGLKDIVSNLLSKKTNMEEDTLMNRAMSGHTAMKESTTGTSSTSGNTKTTRRVQRRPRNKSQQQNNSSTISSPNEKCTEPHSDDSDREQCHEQSYDEESNDQNRNSHSKSITSDLPAPPSRSPSYPEPILPEGWAQVTTEDGRIYYYHKITRVSRWDLPSQEDTNQINEQIHQSQQKMAECSIHPDECDLENDEDQIKIRVASIIKYWIQPSNMNRCRSIPELLTTIPTILDTSIVPEGSIFKEPLTLSTPPTDVKKAYLRAVRLVHPDKLVALDLNFEKKLLAQEIFIAISEKYDLYRKAHGI